MKSGIVLAGLLVAVVSSAHAQDGGRKVSGRVFDDSTGCPLRGAELAAVGLTPRASTDANGRYYLKGIPATPFTLQVILTGYMPQVVADLLVADSSARVDFSLLRADTYNTSKPKIPYPSLKCILDRKDSGGRYDRR